MDPGNWATDLEGGARFGYQLIWVLLMSNLMAVLLQTLSARLGIVAGRDLAQACRDNYPKPIAFALWILCELAIAACDLAEVLGTAIGLNLLFGLPLIYGVIITGFDTMLFLVIQHFGIRKLEAFILVFVSTIGICFAIELFLANPDLGRGGGGLRPASDVREPLCCGGHSRGDRHAPQPLSPLCTCPDARVVRTIRCGEAGGVPVQSHRYRHRA